ncbi:DUF937 domain-containing protein [Nitratireductor basaltis]|uniref:DUF937 domain-containing protein n=1 Tax=Nitratireductor basaltis TaxID=472175 RepID=A0A084UDE5_9HYPH|nr:DUF937 domain-containing protein [Nitratireductor basaltis]KFB10981.1 hypothetical protein EL18_02022 [Nitratireductor basaltis]
MLPLFDLLKNAQNGHALDELSRQFNLPRDKTEEAMEALLPAFSQGLKRNASDPGGMGGFLAALSSGKHAQYFEDAGYAASPEGRSEGNGILGHLFGSKDVSRAVAAQASQFTGIDQTTLKQMLPALASMIMGGLFKQSAGQVPQARASGSGGMLGEIMKEVMRHQQSGSAPSGSASSNPFGKMLEDLIGGAAGRAAPSGGGDNPLGQMFEDFLGGGQKSDQSATRQQAPRGNNPLGDIFNDFVRQGQSGPATAEPAAPQPSQPQSSGNPWGDLFGEMFEPGRKPKGDTSGDYERGMENIFEQFKEGMNRR